VFPNTRNCAQIRNSIAIGVGVGVGIGVPAALALGVGFGEGLRTASQAVTSQLQKETVPWSFKWEEFQGHLGLGAFVNGRLSKVLLFVCAALAFTAAGCRCAPRSHGHRQLLSDEE